MNSDFPRIKRLPPYVFSIVNDLKAKARAQGEDIIDFGLGNPDHPRPDTSSTNWSKRRSGRYSSLFDIAGHPRLRKAMCNWYKTRYDVDLDFDTEAIVTIGSKEGLSHLALATVEPGDAVLVPNPAYPIHPYGFVIAGADIRHVPLVPGVDFFAELEKAIQNSWPCPKMLVLNFPGQSHHPVRGTGFLRESHRDRPRARHLGDPGSGLRRYRVRRLYGAFDPAGARRQGDRRGILLAVQEL